MLQTNAELIDIVKWPCELSEERKLTFLSLCEHRTHLRGGELSFSNERGLYYVLNGLATFSLTSLEMKPFVGGVLGYQDWQGAAMTYDFPTVTLYCVEIEPLSMLFLAKNKLENLLQKDTAFFQFVYSISQINTPRYLQATIISHYGIEERLIYALLELAARKKPIVGALPQLTITQQQICNITGVSRPRANEVFNQFKEDGLIDMTRGTITLNNIQQLYAKLSHVNLELNNPYLKLLQTYNK